MDFNKEEDFNELSFYTLSHKDPSFIHQHIVDAYGAQIADETTKEIRTIFSLVGLYLYLEKGYTGREVQGFHILMSKNKIKWPKIDFPKNRGEINVSDVLTVKSGFERDKMIRNWCLSIWGEYRESRNLIVEIVEKYEKIKKRTANKEYKK
ncbi:hypothetical protein SAMN04488519_10833 [Algoriphagus ornithinivorans]|uniref:Uncharacterized protein n=1 Tax=Algoriphagus ornithinivorans TaxID=226506 RepID=A0A1I5I1X8_9BACT|nr:DUF5946 family protein [Algoriphagus ornithinivorans]SFO54594.1 hypothetical protein SAMN04488519_10833 [Algoriphagus ornithinivorans]